MRARPPRLRRFAHELERRLQLRYQLDRAAEQLALAEHLRRTPRPKMRLSVIVPVWGIALGDLRSLIASLDRQTYARWELCTCDDGDPDPAIGAYLRARAASRPDRHRHATHARQQGIAAATRDALALAHGDAVVFVDGDDLLHPRALEAVAAELEARPDVDLVYTDHDKRTDWGWPVAPSRKPAFSPELLLQLNYVNHLVAVRRALIDGSLFADDTAGAQDWALCLHAARAARGVAHLPFVLYHWRQRAGSMAVDARAKPWASEAAWRVRNRHVAALDARLALEGERHGSAAVLTLRPDVAAPPLHVLDLGAGAPPVRYDGPLLAHAVAAGSPRQVARRADEALRGAGDDELVLLRSAFHPALRGDARPLAAYALQRSIGCVWPFRAPRLRGGYTSARRGLRALEPADSQLGGCTGNVLTGPTHGLLCRVGVVRATGGLERHADDVELEAIGARLGLAARATGLRHVSAASLVSGSPRPLPHVAAPARDPHV